MFLVILISLRLLGKRSVAQLSVFELGVIIGLGTAAGDPMLYRDVGLLPGLLSFMVIIGLYRLITYIINYNDKVEKLLEGEPVYIVENGKLNYKNFMHENIAREEIYMQLRYHKITHLGQVKFGILETDGKVSVVLYPDNEILWGLPILPHLYKKQQIRLHEQGMYACAHCGNPHKMEGDGREHICPSCDHKEWIPAIHEKRIE